MVLQEGVRAYTRRKSEELKEKVEKELKKVEKTEKKEWFDECMYNISCRKMTPHSNPFISIGPKRDVQ